MTIEKSSEPQEEAGNIDREDSWVQLEPYVNIRCHIQEKSRITVTDDEGNYLTQEHRDVIYHLNRSVYLLDGNHTDLRIITHIDPLIKLSFPVSQSELSNIAIYEFKGHIRQVAAIKRAKQLYTLRVERNYRWHY